MQEILFVLAAGFLDLFYPDVVLDIRPDRSQSAGLSNDHQLVFTGELGPAFIVIGH